MGICPGLADVFTIAQIEISGARDIDDTGRFSNQFFHDRCGALRKQINEQRLKG
jgi:hypothetical protein